MSLAQLDPEVRAAVLHAPAVLTGLPADVHQSLVDQETQALHGERLARLKTLEDAYEEVNAALQIASDDMDRVVR